MENKRTSKRNSVNLTQFPIEVEFKVNNETYFIGKVLNISYTGVLVALIEDKEFTTFNESYKIHPQVKEGTMGDIYFIGSGKNTYIHSGKIIRIESNRILNSIAFEFNQSIEETPLSHYIM
jgi:hypothetical protein